MASRFSTGGGMMLGPPGRVERHAEPVHPERKSKAPGFSRPSLTAGGKKPGTSKRVSAGMRLSSAAPSKSRPSSTRASGQGSVRMSSAGAARLSSMGGRGSRVMKDPRPLSDKLYQQTCIKQLCLYLAENCYGREVKPSDFRSPTMATFLNVLNFILDKLHPSLVVDGMRLAEELPLLLKALGYPFSISKNHLLSVGSPHSWPILLGMLMWLIEGDQGDLTDQILFPANSDFTAPSELSQECEIESLIYKAFMERSEDYEQLIEQRTEMYQHKYQNSRQSLEDLETANNKLQEEVDELSKNSIAALQAKSQENQHDYEELVSYINITLEPLVENTEKSCREMDAAVCRAEVQIGASKEKARELEEEIKQQSMSAADARILKEKIANKEDSLAKLRQVTAECESSVSELQMQYNTSISKLDQVGKMVNNKLRRLVAVLPDATCLGSLHYDTSKRADREFLTKLLSQAKSIRQGIQHLHDRVAGEISETERQVIGIESTVSVLKNDLVKKNLDVESAEHDVEIEKTQLDQLKKKIEEETKNFMAEKHALDKKMLSIQEELEKNNDMKRELESVRKEVCNDLAKMEADTSQKTQDLQQYCVELAKYLEACKMKSKRVSKKVELLVEEFHKIQMPAVKEKYLSPPKEGVS